MIGLSTSVPKKKWNKQEATTYRWKQEKTDFYAVWVEASTRSFFPFLFLTSTQPAWGEWAITTWRLGFSTREPSFSESKEEVKWTRFWVVAMSEDCAGPLVEGTIEWGSWSIFTSLPSSSELEKSESATGGGEQGAHHLDLGLERLSLFFFVGRDGQVFCKCPD